MVSKDQEREGSEIKENGMEWRGRKDKSGANRCVSAHLYRGGGGKESGEGEVNRERNGLIREKE